MAGLVGPGSLPAQLLLLFGQVCALLMQNQIPKFALLVSDPSYPVTLMEGAGSRSDLSTAELRVYLPADLELLQLQVLLYSSLGTKNQQK